MNNYIYLTPLKTYIIKLFIPFFNTILNSFKSFVPSSQKNVLFISWHQIENCCVVRYANHTILIKQNKRKGTIFTSSQFTAFTVTWRRTVQGSMIVG